MLPIIRKQHFMLVIKETTIGFLNKEAAVEEMQVAQQVPVQLEAQVQIQINVEFGLQMGYKSNRLRRRSLL